MDGKELLTLRKLKEKIDALCEEMKFDGYVYDDCNPDFAVSDIYYNNEIDKIIIEFQEK